MKLIGNAIVGQSGGPTAAINATLAGVIRGVEEIGKETIPTLYGMRNGLEGLLDKRIVNLTQIFDNEEKIELLVRTPSAALGSCRKKLPQPKAGDETFEKILSVFREYDIRYFFYIGGNDSMDTVDKLYRFCAEKGYEIRVVGVPKTIDNDLMGTDHTPGFGSAAKYIATTMREILCDCAVYTMPAVTIVELMGRDAGWLTASAALASLDGQRDVDAIYLPERVFSYERLYKDIATAFTRHPNVVIAVSEGVRLSDSTYVGEGTQNGVSDIFGHKYLAGTAKTIEEAVKAKFGCKVRSVELNLPQRCASHLASATDLFESLGVARHAVLSAVEGVSGAIAVICREAGEKYAVHYDTCSIGEVANAIRYVPDAYINAGANGITEEGLAYLRPLISGEVAPVYKNGLPVHFILDKYV